MMMSSEMCVMCKAVLVFRSSIASLAGRGRELGAGTVDLLPRFSRKQSQTSHDISIYKALFVSSATLNPSRKLQETLRPRRSRSSALPPDTLSTRLGVQDY